MSCRGALSILDENSVHIPSSSLGEKRKKNHFTLFWKKSCCYQGVLARTWTERRWFPSVGVNSADDKRVRQAQALTEPCRMIQNERVNCVRVRSGGVWSLLLIQSWVRNAGFGGQLFLPLFSLWSPQLSFLLGQAAPAFCCGRLSGLCHPSPNLLTCSLRSVKRYQRASLSLRAFLKRSMFGSSGATWQQVGHQTKQVFFLWID